MFFILFIYLNFFFKLKTLTSSFYSNLFLPFTKAIVNLRKTVHVQYTAKYHD